MRSKLSIALMLCLLAVGTMLAFNKPTANAGSLSTKSTKADGCCVTGDCCCPGQGECCDPAARAKATKSNKPAKKGFGCCVTGDCCCPGQGDCCWTSATVKTEAKDCCSKGAKACCPATAKAGK